MIKLEDILKLMRYRLLGFMFLIFMGTQIACTLFSAPVRLPSDSDAPDVEIHQIPEALKRGEVGAFALITTPGNICLGEISYIKIGSSEYEPINLPELIANSDGVCTWSWKVPMDAKTGAAVFWVAVEENGRGGFTSPRKFCVEKCPWGAPADQP